MSCRVSCSCSKATPRMPRHLQLPITYPQNGLRGNGTSDSAMNVLLPNPMWQRPVYPVRGNTLCKVKTRRLTRSVLGSVTLELEAS